MEKAKIKYNIAFFVICFYILLFQNILQIYIKPIQYFDELLAILYFPLLFFSKKNESTKKKNLLMLLLIIIMFGIGIYSNIKYKYQPLGVALGDSLLIFKFFFVYGLSELVWKNKLLDEKNKSIILINVKIITILFFLLTVFNYLFIIWPSTYRFGIMSNRIFYNHPTILASSCILLFSLYVLCSNKIKYKYGLLLLILLLSTLRFKAIGAAGIILILVYLSKKRKKPLTMFKILLFGLLILLFAWNQLSYYYFDISDSARSQLTQTSIAIAKDYFPFGTGFATFGSYLSGVYYSPVYSIYQISHIYGITMSNTSFISDTFWPMILGQLGIIGLLLYIILIYKIFKDINKSFDNNNIGLYLSKIICFIYLIISSTSEAAFVNPIAIPLAIIIAL